MMFMGYDVGGLATESGDLHGFEIVDMATADQSVNGDDLAILYGPDGPCEFHNGEFRVVNDGQTYSLRAENDYTVSGGRWVKEIIR